MKKSHKTYPDHLAVFDFDNTLTIGDSLLIFLLLFQGYFRTFFLFLLAVGLTLIKYLLGKMLGDDFKGSIKAEWLSLSLKNVHIDTLRPIITKMKNRIKWNDPVIKHLKDHQAAQDYIIIATGALDIYIKQIIRNDIKYNELFCTHMNLSNNRLSGTFIGKNCVRSEKAQKIRDFISKNGPFKKISIYGNLPSDGEMLELATDKHII